MQRFTYTQIQKFSGSLRDTKLKCSITLKGFSPGILFKKQILNRQSQSGKVEFYLYAVMARNNN